MPEENRRTWILRPLRSQRLMWDGRYCPHCGLGLLTNEEVGFCCGPNGSRLNDVPPLPPLPHEFNVFLNSQDISPASRVLNLLYSFAALESSAEFPTIAGPQGFFAVQGRLYHRIRPNHVNSGIRWLLYDGYLRENAPFGDWIASLPAAWTTAVAQALLNVNPLAQQLRFLSSLTPQQFPHARISIRDAGVAEIAAIMVYDNTAEGEAAARQLVVARRDGRNQNIPTVSRLWEPLAYPLFFPHGTLGWGLAGHGLGDEHQVGDLDAPTSLIWHVRARLLREPRFDVFGRLTNEYVVDMWTRELESRLHYIRMNQRRLRQQDAELMGEDFVEDNENVFLPASFLGSRRWASEHVADALAVAASLGVPTFFITVTCNPMWEEIQERLLPGQTFADRPVIVARVFKQKLSQLLSLLNTMFASTGKPIYVMHTVEFQKRGLPHVHILVKYDAACVTPQDIDSIISAEIPEDPADAELVRRYMLHTHPPADRPPSRYCQREAEDGTRHCRFRYPHPLQERTTIDDEGRVHYRRRNPGDEMVVPHCLPLLRVFQCHLNFECANTSSLFQYLFKYIHKGIVIRTPLPREFHPDMWGHSFTGPDRARFRVAAEAEDRIDEIEEYWSGRYLSAGEAVWRILGFHITRKRPAVTMLPVHLPDSNHRHQYHRRNAQHSTLSRLDRYFHRPQGTFNRSGVEVPFRTLTYTEYFRLFRLTKFNADLLQRPGHYAESDIPEGQTPMVVIQRQDTYSHVTRLQPAMPSQGERFYLRAILAAKPASSFQDARTVEGIIYGTFQAAAIAMGLFADEREAEYAMAEAVATLRTPRQLRFLFIHLLVNECCPTPLAVWQRFRHDLSHDYYLQNALSWELGEDHALQDLSRYLEEHGKTLHQFGLPQPAQHASEVAHELRRWARNAGELRARADRARESFNPEQRAIFDEVVQAVINRRSLLLFVDGKAGRGKTFLVNAICDIVRSMGKIAIPTATSAVAAQLYPGGRTAHSAFKIPVNEFNELLVSPIEVGSSRAQLLQETSVFVWDEAPMANKACLACTDELLRRVMDVDEPFGHKIFILLGDFRQTCPVIPRGTRAQVVDASIRSSHLWPLFQVRRLIRPVRNAGDPEYAAFVDAIGDGAGPDVNLHLLAQTHEAAALIDHVYPHHILSDPTSCATRSILAPTNAQVNDYNTNIKNRIEGMDRTYLAADSLKEAEEVGLEPSQALLDFATRQTPPGLPEAHLALRTNTVVRLMRNFSIERGLVKNMRAVVTDVGNRLITIRRLTGHLDEDLLIPRITFTYNLAQGHTLLRKQFPLSLAYATTFNSCQGLTLDRVGVDCTRPVFSHGQLYTALSRIKTRDHGLVRLPPGERSTKNVTYPEILI